MYETAGRRLDDAAAANQQHLHVHPCSASPYINMVQNNCQMLPPQWGSHTQYGSPQWGSHTQYGYPTYPYVSADIPEPQMVYGHPGPALPSQLPSPAPQARCEVRARHQEAQQTKGPPQQSPAPVHCPPASQEASHHSRQVSSVQSPQPQKTATVVQKPPRTQDPPQQKRTQITLPPNLDNRGPVASTRPAKEKKSKKDKKSKKVHKEKKRDSSASSEEENLYPVQQPAPSPTPWTGPVQAGKAAAAPVGQIPPTPTIYDLDRIEKDKIRIAARQPPPVVAPVGQMAPAVGPADDAPEEPQEPQPGPRTVSSSPSPIDCNRRSVSSTPEADYDVQSAAGIDASDPAIAPSKPGASAENLPERTRTRRASQDVPRPRPVSKRTPPRSPPPAANKKHAHAAATRSGCTHDLATHSSKPDNRLPRRQPPLVLKPASGGRARAQMRRSTPSCGSCSPRHRPTCWAIPSYSSNSIVSAYSSYSSSSRSRSRSPCRQVRRRCVLKCNPGYRRSTDSTVRLTPAPGATMRR